MFPVSDKSQDVQKALIRAVKKLGVDIKLNAKVEDILVNENNEAIYYLDSDILVENYIQSSDFSSIPLQSYEIIEIEVSANYEIEIIFDDGYGQYTIYKGIVSI